MKRYLVATQHTNHAPNHHLQAKKDRIPLSVNLLSIFETVTNCNQRSLKASRNDVDGSAPRIKLRSPEQLITAGEGGRLRPSMQARNRPHDQLRTVNFQKPPSHILELRTEAVKHIDTSEPSWLLWDTNDIIY